MLEPEDNDSVKEYATVAEEDGENYRDIASMMSELGFEMNHSSARNHIVRIMKRFAESFAEHLSDDVKTDDEMYRIAKDPMFQSSMSELLHAVEIDRRRKST